MFRRAYGVFPEPKCGECVGELMECFGSLWNVSEACGTFRKLVEYFGELGECCGKFVECFGGLVNGLAA